jgi:hypothetical protein
VKIAEPVTWPMAKLQPETEPERQARVAAPAPAVAERPVAPVSLDPALATTSSTKAEAVPAPAAPIRVAVAVPAPVPAGVPSGLSGGLTTADVKAVYEREVENARNAGPQILEAAELRGLYCVPDPGVRARGGRCQISWEAYLQGMRRFLDQ